MRLIAEIGSCHMGYLNKAYEALERCKKAGIHEVKFQLFPNDPKYTAVGNVWLNPVYFEKIFNRGKELNLSVSSSVFDEESFEFLLNLKPKYIKFAYSKKDQLNWIFKTLDADIEAIVSCDIMTDNLVPKEATKLYCIPEYPVRYEVNFDEIFPRFDGFSDHTLGIRQTEKAIQSGAKLIEKHVKLGDSIETCPDARFAVKIEEFARCLHED